MKFHRDKCKVLKDPTIQLCKYRLGVRRLTIEHVGRFRVSCRLLVDDESTRCDVTSKKSIFCYINRNIVFKLGSSSLVLTCDQATFVPCCESWSWACKKDIDKHKIMQEEEKDKRFGKTVSYKKWLKKCDIVCGCVRTGMLASIWSYLPKWEGLSCWGKIRFLLSNPKW